MEKTLYHTLRKKQLEDKFGAVVVRLAGDDRYDTSLEVDHRLVKDEQASTTRFVVGGNGACRCYVSFSCCC